MPLALEFAESLCQCVASTRAPLHASRKRSGARDFVEAENQHGVGSRLLAWHLLPSESVAASSRARFAEVRSASGLEPRRRRLHPERKTRQRLPSALRRAPPFRLLFSELVSRPGNACPFATPFPCSLNRCVLRSQCSTRVRLLTQLTHALLFICLLCEKKTGCFGRLFASDISPHPHE